MRFLLPIALGLLLSVPAHAVPTLEVGWDTCAGPVTRCIPQGTQEVSIFSSVIGMDTPHTGAEVVFLISRNSPGVFPDAWRFDLAGCEGSSLWHASYVSLSATCPTLQGQNPIHITDYSMDPQGHGVVTLASSYPTGSTATNPAIRYMLTQLVLDFRYAVNGPGDPSATCGFLETSMRIHVARAGWIDQATGSEHFIGGTTPDLLANDPGAGCSPVPAQATTWGAIRGQYR